ncbi:MAG: hypothetical protein AAGJ70_00615 [Pseudomonadota bacterium]
MSLTLPLESAVTRNGRIAPQTDGPPRLDRVVIHGEPRPTPDLRQAVSVAPRQLSRLATKFGFAGLRKPPLRRLPIVLCFPEDFFVDLPGEDNVLPPQEDRTTATAMIASDRAP